MGGVGELIGAVSPGREARYFGEYSNGRLKCSFEFVYLDLIYRWPKYHAVRPTLSYDEIRTIELSVYSFGDSVTDSSRYQFSRAILPITS